jgi:hypothetical protein
MLLFFKTLKFTKLAEKHQLDFELNAVLHFVFLWQNCK